jgi:hypothetical protein
MAPKLLTDNISAVVANRSIAGIVLWNRLEGRPRAEKFDRALRAEVRDPLWMLTKQWQMGEFQGDDAGSPIFLKAHIDTTRIQKYQAVNGPVEAFDDTIPLEAHVERMAIPLVLGGFEVSLDIRLLMGRYWLKLVKPLAAAAVKQYIDAYPIHEPDPTVAGDALATAHPEAWSSYATVAGRRMDGAKFYAFMSDPTHHAADGIAALVGKEAQADTLAKRFVAWFDKLLYEPAQNPAWLPERLEYQFALSSQQAKNEKVLLADQYYQGHLDWYNFDVDPQAVVLGDPAPKPDLPTPTTLTMLPTQVTFNGMPNTRWWEFEDGATNFGDIKPDTTDLAKLLLIEFGLVYANDWFMVPFTVPAGSLVDVRGMACTNVFGERLWIEPAGAGDDDNWQRWAMFLLSIKGVGHEPADLSLMIPPAAQAVLEGRDLEVIMFTRDEMANMVWGVEKTIPLPSGEPKPGREAADETRAFFERDLVRRLGGPPAPPPPAPGAKVRYKVMTSVPENWIPMIPVHVANDNRKTQLQRAAMLRILEGDPVKPSPVRPRTSLLRHGLDQAKPDAYFLHEEEVPRAGVVVTQGFQRTRWRDGRAWVWLGVRKQTGRGGSSSGLAFDQIVDVK